MTRFRIRTMIAVGLLFASTGVVVAGTGDAAAAPRPAAVDAAHPYSDPVYYPLRQPMKVDCVRGNPGCPGYHTDWTMDLSVMQNRLPGNDTIYAMGAGIFHYIRTGFACDTGHPTSFGTTVEIDHGGGIVSRYGHLDHALVADGTSVAGGQPIGVMGTTGKNGNCAFPYLDFQVQRGFDLVEMATLEACYNNTTETWPVDRYPAYPTWNDVPQTTPMPAPSGDCIPRTTPDTPSKPAAPTVTRSGSGALRVSWTGQPTGSTSAIEFQLYHPSTSSWGTEEFRYLGAGRTVTTFSGLANGRTYRAHISFHNDAGWSLPSADTRQIPGAAPDAPAYRGIATGPTDHGRTAYIRLSWYLSVEHGIPVTGYDVEYRLGTTGTWHARTIAASSVSYRWDGLRRHTHYQVRVRALSSGGASPYTARNSTTA